MGRQGSQEVMGRSKVREGVRGRAEVTAAAIFSPTSPFTFVHSVNPEEVRDQPGSQGGQGGVAGSRKPLGASKGHADPAAKFLDFYIYIYDCLVSRQT